MKSIKLKQKKIKNYEKVKIFLRKTLLLFTHKYDTPNDPSKAVKVEWPFPAVQLLQQNS